ncbi:hypothetical protein C1N81_04155 (plasmid) [Streptomyces sp. SGAir0957]
MCAYQRYTGTGRQAATEAVALLTPGAPLIPAAKRAQRLLETELLHWVLETHRAFTQYPLGLVSVVPSPDGIRLRLESRKRAEDLLTGLLPCWEPDRQVHGVSGLRIRRRTEAGLELHRLGAETSIWLTGCSAGAFANAERTLRQRLNELGWEATWTSKDWTAAEQRWEADLQPLILMPSIRKASWLASGLLRRVGLLHTVTVPQVVTGYRGWSGDTWVLKLDFLRSDGFLLQEFVDALTDPTDGLPLEPDRHRVLVPDKHVGRMFLKGGGGTAALEVRYDQFDYPSLRAETEVFAAIEQRVTRVRTEHESAARA